MTMQINRQASLALMMAALGARGAAQRPPTPSRATGRRLTDQDYEALCKAEEKRQRKNAARRGTF